MDDYLNRVVGDVEEFLAGERENRHHKPMVEIPVVRSRKRDNSTVPAWAVAGYLSREESAAAIRGRNTILALVLIFTAIVVAYIYFRA